MKFILLLLMAFALVACNGAPTPSPSASDSVANPSASEDINRVEGKTQPELDQAGTGDDSNAEPDNSAENEPVVAINDDGFDKESLEVAPSTTVVWVNHTTDPVRVKATLNGNKDFPELEVEVTPSERAGLSFSEVGTYSITSSANDELVMEIEVTD